MNRLLLFFFILMTAYAKALSVTNSEMIVQRFGNNMMKWCSTKNIDYRKAVLKDCHNQDGTPKKECMVKDALMLSEGAKSGLSRKHYAIQNYLNVFQNFLRMGNVSYKMYNIEERPYEDISITNYSSKAENIARTCTYVSCNVQISGSLNYNFKSLFAISGEGKIWQIAPYEETTDKRTGKKKVRINWDDFIEHYESIGFTYNYGKYFPVGGSFNYSPDDIPFMVSVDFGVNFDDDKYIIDKVEMTDIMNYKREKKTLDAKFFLTVTPQFYIKYFSVGCGVGFLYMSGTEETSSYASSSSGSSNSFISVSGGASSSTSSELLKPMIRPVVKGFIPLSKELYVAISAGYDYVFGYRVKNGFNVGLGFQWKL